MEGKTPTEVKIEIRQFVFDIREKIEEMIEEEDDESRQQNLRSIIPLLSDIIKGLNYMQVIGNNF